MHRSSRSLFFHQHSINCFSFIYIGSKGNRKDFWTQLWSLVLYLSRDYSAKPILLSEQGEFPTRASIQRYISEFTVKDQYQKLLEKSVSLILQQDWARSLCRSISTHCCCIVMYNVPDCKLYQYSLRYMMPWRGRWDHTNPNVPVSAESSKICNMKKIYTIWVTSCSVVSSYDICFFVTNISGSVVSNWASKDFKRKQQILVEYGDVCLLHEHLLRTRFVCQQYSLKV